MLTVHPDRALSASDPWYPMLDALQCSAAQGGSANGLVYNPVHELLCARPLSPLDLVLAHEAEGPPLELAECHIVLPKLPWIPAE